MSNGTPSLRIGLLDNSCHSLVRGYELWNRGQRAQDVWTLKESIVWIHHGVELALKQLVVQTNEYLVFERVDEAVRKLAHLRRQRGTGNASVLDLFDHDDSVITVGFRKLVQRVSVMLDVAELTEGSPLRTYIDELARYRNRITHFSVQLHIAEITSLLSDLMEPLLEVLEREVDDPDFVSNCIPEIRRQAQLVRRLDMTFATESERRVARLIRLFRGQRVPGELLGQEGVLQLPVFTQVVEEDMAPGAYRGVDIRAEGPDENWVVEVKLRFSPRVIDQLEVMRTEHEDARVWLVIMSEVPAGRRAELIQRGFLVSTLPNVVRLEGILLAERQ